jgi:hypothetical protein
VGVDRNFNITEEMASLVTLEDTKTTSDLLEGVMAIFHRLYLNLTNLSEVTMNSAAAMGGRREGW